MALVPADALSEPCQLALVLRVVVDQRGQLVYGEMVDVRGVSLGRFKAWDEMQQRLDAWLMSQITP